MATATTALHRRMPLIDSSHRLAHRATHLRRRAESINGGEREASSQSRIGPFLGRILASSGTGPLLTQPVDEGPGCLAPRGLRFAAEAARFERARGGLVP